MESKISYNLVFLPTTKLVWQLVQELYSDVNNLTVFMTFIKITFIKMIFPRKIIMQNLRVPVKNSIFTSPFLQILKPCKNRGIVCM